MVGQVDGICQFWFVNLRIGNESPVPVPIKNRQLVMKTKIDFLYFRCLLENGQLRENLSEHHDYECISEKFWKALSTWYGCDQNQIIRRELVKDMTMTD